MKLPKPLRPIIGMKLDTGKPFPVRTMNPVPADYIYYDVPFIPQRHINLCGDACALMLLRFCGIDTGGKDTRQNPRGVLEGESTDSLTQDYPAPWSSHALPTNRTSTSDGLAALLSWKGPVICALGTLGGLSGHFVLLTGISGDRPYFNDPWKGRNMTKTLKEFNKALSWDDRDCMLYINSPKPPPSE
jgi:ABC-type bacteriocin/lantibiotic exporter with double-glycine peptidase domain